MITNTRAVVKEKTANTGIYRSDAALRGILSHIENEPASVKLLAMTLHSYADGAGRCWPSEATLAEVMGCSTRTVSRAVCRLEDAGLLLVWRRHPGRSGNAYLLHYGGAVPVGQHARELARPAPARRGPIARMPIKSHGLPQESFRRPSTTRRPVSKLMPWTARPLAQWPDVWLERMVRHANRVYRRSRVEWLDLYLVDEKVRLEYPEARGHEYARLAYTILRRHAAGIERLPRDGPLALRARTRLNLRYEQAEQAIA